MQLFRNCLRSYLLCFFMLCYGMAQAGQAWQKDAVITLQAKQITLGKIFKAILQQTGIKIMYAGKMVNEQEVYTNVQFKATKLDDALQSLFKGKGLEWIYRDEVIILRPKSTVTVADSIPTLNISGRVVDDMGAPLPGATVQVKGMGKGTAADASGNFRVMGVPSNATLAVSFTGFEQQDVPLLGRSELALALKRQAKVIDKVEVFSTGYQDVPKERATGSFEFVNNEELNRRVGSDILSRLEGVTTSVFFDRRGTSPSQTGISLNNLNIRGLSTLSQNLKSPLVVLDNFPYEGNINNINPNDVENISILKDAAAASIWGARAANGVIVITTKKGQFNQPVRLSLSANISVIEKPDLFHFPTMSTSEFIDVESFLFGKEFYNTVINNVQKPALSPVTEILLKRRSGLISAADSAVQIDALRHLDVRNDFSKYIYRQAISQQYAINLNGGSDKIKYAISAGFDQTPSILKGDQYKRLTFNTDNSFVPIEKLTLRIGLRYTNTESSNNSMGNIGASGYNYRSNQRMPQYTRFADDQGNYLTYAKEYREGFTDTAGAGRLLDWKFRTLGELENNDNKVTQQEFVFNTGLIYQVTKYLNLQVYYQYLYSNSATTFNLNTNLYSTRNLINQFTNLNSSTASLRYPVPIGNIFDDSRGTTTAHLGRGQVNLNHTFNKKHQVTALAGIEIRESIRSSTGLRTYGYDPNKLSSSLMDYITRFPRYGNLAPSPIPSGPSRYSKATDHFVSLFANAAYTYDDRYTISGSARKDAANQFGVKVNDQWKPFWSAGISWNISNEPFFKVNWIPYLRLRTNYGYQGNVNNSLSPYTILSYEAASSTLDNVPFANITSPANPGLSWETIKQYNIGVDFQLLNRRITGSVDWYKKSSDNLILDVPVDLTTGVNSVQMNSASMYGKGVDVTINTLNLNSKLKWNSEFMLSYTTNKVTDFVTTGLAPVRVSGVVLGDGSRIIPRIGISPYALFSYPWAGLDPATGDPQGYLGQKLSKNYLELSNQRFDTSNVNYHGSAIPTVFGSFNNIFRYKNFSLLVSIRYQLGFYFRKSTISYSALYSNGTIHYDYTNRWKLPGDEKYTVVPSQIYPVSNAQRDNFYAYSSVNVLKGDNIRLESVRLGYDLDNVRFKLLPFRAVQLFASINNIGMLWAANKDKLDPSYDMGNSAYPNPKTWAMGFKIDF